MTLKPGDTPKPEKRQKSQKKAKKEQKPATFYIWQIARNEREKSELLKRKLSKSKQCSNGSTKC
jgi:hypothetical protein